MPFLSDTVLKVMGFSLVHTSARRDVKHIFNRLIFQDDFYNLVEVNIRQLWS